MKDKLREYVERLFEDAPKTSKMIEMKEEILQNVVDKYDDTINEGKTEEAAYNIAVASIGDVTELIDGIIKEKKSATLSNETIKEQARRRSALFISAAVTLYILCIVPVLIIQSEIGVVFMFIMIAAATGLLVYNGCTKPNYTKVDDTVVDEFLEWKNEKDESKSMMKAISSALWSITVVIYIVVSFFTMGWHITWVIFLIAGAIENAIKAVIEYRKTKE